MAVRSLVWRLGHRYRVENRDLPGSPDLANRSKGWAIFVNGCFWHGHKNCSKTKSGTEPRIPENNREYWAEKLRQNRKRDAEKARRLKRLGFDVLIVWECELYDEAELQGRLWRTDVTSADPSENGNHQRSFRVAGLFAGVGGIEEGLHRAGHRTETLCEIDPGADAVLAERFPEVPERIRDVADLTQLDAGVDLVTGGFPCQDLSQAGETRGIDGDESALVMHVFRLLRKRRIPWVLLENVPFMLQLQKGAAMRTILGEIEDLGYRWAYRVLDTRAFGLPQRRKRVFLLAATDEDPAEYLFADDVGAPDGEGDHEGRACGFYWTEGTRGLGWAVDGVPTLKGGSGVGIPSPPAIWMPDGRIVKPDIRDAERLQGFPADWTSPAEEVVRDRFRWKLVGNAVTVDVAEWLGDILSRPPRGMSSFHLPLGDDDPLPEAAFGSAAGRFAVEISTWPVARPSEPLVDFLEFEPELLSERATRGFRDRLRASSLRYPAEFMEALDDHLERMVERTRGAATPA